MRSEDGTQVTPSSAELHSQLLAERRARALVEQKLLVTEHFLSSVTHDLRTPLHAILGWIQLLRAPRLADTEKQQGIAVIERSARAQAKLIEELLDFSRILSGKITLKSEPIEMRALIDEAVRQVEPESAPRTINYTVDTVPEIEVLGDFVRLQQILTDILSLISRRTSRGGTVSVRARRTNTRMEIIIASGAEQRP